MSDRFGNRPKGSGNRSEFPTLYSSMIETRQPRERIDYVLNRDGWYRKHTPRDASCVFRVVAEQVFQSQPHYPLMRRDCTRFMKQNWAVFSKEISPKDTCEQYLKRLQSEETYATDVEMLAMSMLYKRDFVIYHFDKYDPEEGTHNFTDKIRLCQYGDNHYDSVVRTEELMKAGIAQAIVYEIQYAMVFKLGLSVTIPKELMLNKPKTSPKKRVAKLEREAGFTENGYLIPGALCWINPDPSSSKNWEGEWGVVQQCVTTFTVWVASTDTGKIEDFRKDQLKVT